MLAHAEDFSKSKSVHPVAREQALVAAQMALDVFGNDTPSILVGCRPAVNLTLDIAALFSPGPAIYTWRLLPAESEEAKQAAACKCTLPLPDLRRIPGQDGSDGSSSSSTSSSGSGTASSSPVAPGAPTQKTPSRSTKLAMTQPHLMKTSSNTTVYPPSLDLGWLRNLAPRAPGYMESLCNAVAAARDSASGTHATAYTGQTVKCVAKRVRRQAICPAAPVLLSRHAQRAAAQAGGRCVPCDGPSPLEQVRTIALQPEASRGGAWMCAGQLTA